jgi:hypothetical protein
VGEAAGDTHEDVLHPIWLTSSVLMVLQPRSGRLYLTGAALWTHSPMHVLFFDRPLGYIIPLKRPDLVLILTTISSLLHSTRTSDATSGALVVTGMLAALTVKCEQIQPLLEIVFGNFSERAP